MMIDLDGEPYFIEQLDADDVQHVMDETEAHLAATTDPLDAALLGLNLTALRQHADMLADEERTAAALRNVFAHHGRGV